MTVREAYERTQERRLYLETQGYTVVEKWECDLNRELLDNPEMKKFWDQNKIFEPLNPRGGIKCYIQYRYKHYSICTYCLAFFGGRTNATKLYHKVKRDKKSGKLRERIDYIDVCSLYPWSNKYGEYPVGHPEIILDNFEPITKTNRPYKGIIKCQILPPKKLYHPVLPYRSGGKTIFPLCSTCANTRQKTRCHHTDQERSLVGEWVSLELYEAVKQGYQVRIHIFNQYNCYLLIMNFRCFRYLKFGTIRRRRNTIQLKTPGVVYSLVISTCS